MAYGWTATYIYLHEKRRIRKRRSRKEGIAITT
jgi:hypothetical protein